MRASTFLIINAIILTYMLLRIYWSTQKRSRPSAKDTFQAFDIFANAAKGASGKSREKSLNCHFKHNGQTYDAYQVLGVPAGAPFDICQKAFDRLNGAENAELFKAAINALRLSKV